MTDPAKVSRAIGRYLGGNRQLKNTTAKELRHRYGYDTFASTNDLMTTQRRMGYAYPDVVMVYVPSDEEDESAPYEEERERRLEIWQSVKPADDGHVPTELIREAGIDPGEARILAEAGESDGLPEGAEGAAVSIGLPADERLADSPDEDVLLKSTGSDLRSLELARDLELPVFVIADSDVGGESRDVAIGWVEGVNEEAGLVLIKLGETPPEAVDSADEPFELIVARDWRTVSRASPAGTSPVQFRSDRSIRSEVRSL